MQGGMITDVFEGENGSAWCYKHPMSGGKRTLFYVRHQNAGTESGKGMSGRAMTPSCDLRSSESPYDLRPPGTHL